MNKTNYHSHCSFCDGRAPLEDFVKAAIAEGFSAYGVSSHAPLPFSTRWSMDWEQMDDYLAECNRLKEKYASQIELYVGLEIDYLNEESNPSIARFRELPLDYRIGSVHMLYDDNGDVVDIDCSSDVFRKLIDEHFGGDLVRVVHLYYDKLLRMVDLGGFDILGHADKMHYNAACYRPGMLDEPWYNSLMHSYFSEIARKGYMVEINTKAYHQLGTFYPNERYWILLKELGIQVLVNTDAHYVDRISNGRLEALQALRTAGYTTVMELHDGQWEEVLIDY
ncbi:histidinol-phosphatase [Bacteroides ihuae]|uniref:histidinol-phosphatase n=1 Tax=Bacteroides ihuae TaxID=1852362 RepID=UPI0008D8F87A|nr:histidinol-phosphatase [Bacteroides ihuae]